VAFASIIIFTGLDANIQAEEYACPQAVPNNTNGRSQSSRAVDASPAF
jgi:hypothetical protein